MGRHRAPDSGDRDQINPDQPFDHPHLIGETRPSQIKADLDRIAAEERAEADRVVRERGQRNG